MNPVEVRNFLIDHRWDVTVRRPWWKVFGAWDWRVLEAEVNIFQNIVGWKIIQRGSEKKKDDATTAAFTWAAAKIQESPGTATRMEQPTLREALAALEHEQWAAWTRWQLDHPENRERWERQIATPYDDLSEREKDSDREWADKVLAILKNYAV